MAPSLISEKCVTNLLLIVPFLLRFTHLYILNNPDEYGLSWH